MKYMLNKRWDIRFLELAEHISTWSKDPSTKVGAVIVDNSKRIISLGFNGYPQNVPDNDLENRKVKYEKVIHAEINAILFAQRSLEDCTLYVYPMSPCSRCASLIIQSGIKRVVTLKATEEQTERWGDQFKLAEEMFQSAEVNIIYF